jgi:1-deoxy-D-xylulose 5-phosphate reductoisomerase
VTAMMIVVVMVQEKAPLTRIEILTNMVMTADNTGRISKTGHTAGTHGIGITQDMVNMTITETGTEIIIIAIIGITIGRSTATSITKDGIAIIARSHISVIATTIMEAADIQGHTLIPSDWP